MLSRSLRLMVCIVMLTGCSSGGGGNNGNDTDSFVSKGDRLLGIDVNESQVGTYDTAFNLALSLGMDQVKISLDWNQIEPTVGNYDDTMLDIIDAYYPFKNTYVTIVLRPINTGNTTLPADIDGRPLDDSTVISAFENFLTHLHSRLPNLNASGYLIGIHAGNEIDAYLGGDAVAWSQWTTFFDAAKSKIKSLWGATIYVSAIVQYSALIDTAIRSQYLTFAPHGDVILINYYPLQPDFSVYDPSVIPSDFDTMVNYFPFEEIHLQECGYPSSVVNNSSENKQAMFVSEVFKAWDRHKDNIKLIDFTWLHDVSEAQAEIWVDEYGARGLIWENAFKHYVWTLGIRYGDETNKPALEQLDFEASRRGW